MKHTLSRFWMYLLINIIVSALTTLLILAIVNARQEKPAFTGFSPSANEAQHIFPTQTALTQPTLPALDAPTLEITSLYGAGDIQTEFLQIEMLADEDLWLTNWQVMDAYGHEYTFPRLQLNHGGTVDLYTKIGVDSVTDLYWGLTEPLWHSGDVIRILDYDGNIRVTYTVP